MTEKLSEDLLEAAFLRFKNLLAANLAAAFMIRARNEGVSFDDVADRIPLTRDHLLGLMEGKMELYRGMEEIAHLFEAMGFVPCLELRDTIQYERIDEDTEDGTSDE